MKIGLLFVLIVFILLGIWLIKYSNPLLIKLQGNKLMLYNKKCQQQWSIKVVHKESDMLDALQIERKLVVLPNGQRLYVELDDLPPKYDFDKEYREIIEKIFNHSFEEFFSSDGIIIFKGGFDVALFYKTSHDLVLLYPLDESLSQVLMACAKGKKLPLPKEYKQLPLQKSGWKMEFFILDGFINKDI